MKWPQLIVLILRRKIKMRFLKRSLVSACCSVVLFGCTLGPDYKRPDIEMADSWRVNYSSAAELANESWWKKFNDPELDHLISVALQENLNISIAASRVEQFLGALNTTRAEFYPQIGYSGDLGRTRLSKEAFGTGSDPYYSQYDAALGATWQLDLFGRVQRQTEAAIAQVYSSEQGRRGVIMSVVTSVATSYIGLRGLDQQLLIAQETADSYKKTLDIFLLRHKFGTASMMEVAQIDSQYQQALASIPELRAKIAAQENILSILLGKNPDAIKRGLNLAEMKLPEVPSALPSSLLTRRPDIMQAEQNLIAANAQVGVAETLYYPDISITGALGLVSSDLGDFVQTSARTWNLGANIAGPIFTFGRVEGVVKSAEAARDEAEGNYRYTILNALREVNDSLVSTKTTAESYTSQSKRADSLRTYARLAQMRFDNGASSYLEVLYANTELFQAELNSVDAQVAYYNSLVNVYKAMGGGWVDTVVEEVDPTLTIEKRVAEQEYF